ncbi:MAG TPA: cytochrome c oxidase subunit II [Candidatus Baltobacteraceae bacterium]|jgi:cytochrome c oxidase subunit 2|nr:cytochrome c oxidase subunit II [Candidatus Baltobacteraceae bacterium]
MPILHPASLQAMDLRGVWYIFFGAALFVAVVVYGLILFSLLVWRKRPGDDGKLPPQFHTNAPIEITGTVVPLIMVIGLFYVTYVREGTVDFLKPNPYAVVDVTAYRWSWQFRYPGHGIEIAGTPHVPPEMILPLGKMTQINLYSVDVVHSFWVPAFLFKRDATPGYAMHFDITPTRLGVFRGECAEYCGLDHALMTFSVRVVPPAAYDRWAASGGTQAL